MGGETLVLCFCNSCHFDCLLAVSPDNLPATETNPIGRSAPVRTKRETRAFREFEGELWDGWRKRAGEKMFLSSLSASGEEEALCGTSKTQQTNKEVDLFYFLLKAPWSYTRLRHHSAPSISHSEGSRLQRARSKFCSSLFKDFSACSLFFPHG